MKNDLISIIVPVYNTEQYLKKCVMSICQQTYSNIEIILVDDGSKDTSGILCDELAELDKRIKVIHKINGGVSSARNIGISKARGSYIAFVDSDDFCELDMYERLLYAINKYDSDIAMCAFSDFCDSRKQIRKEPLREGYYNKIQIRKDIILNMVGSPKTKPKCAPIMGALWRCLFKRELIIKPKCITMQNIRIAEDLLFEVEYLVRCNSAVVINIPLYNYRNNSNSATHRYMKNFYFDRNIQYEMLCCVLKENGLYDEKFKEYLVSTRIYFGMSAISNELHSEKKYSEMRREIKEIIKKTEFSKNLKWRMISHMYFKEAIIFGCAKLKLFFFVYLYEKWSK